MQCSACGTELEHNAAFCKQCGHPAQPTQAAAQPTPPLAQPQAYGAPPVPQVQAPYGQAAPQGQPGPYGQAGQYGHAAPQGQPDPYGQPGPYGQPPAPPVYAQPTAPPVYAQPTAPGFAQPAAAAPAQNFRSVKEQLSELQAKLPAPLASVPQEVLLAGALMVASALWLGIVVALHLHYTFDLFGTTSSDGFDVSGSDMPGFGLTVLAIQVVLLAFAVWLLFLAWRLFQRDAISRLVALAPLLGYGLAVLFASASTDGSAGTAFALASSDAHGAMPIVTMLMLWAAAALLIGVPSIRQFYAAATPADRAPAGVRAGRIALLIFAAGAGFVGLLYLVGRLVAHDYEKQFGLGVKYLVIGILFIVVALACATMVNRMAAGDPLARVVVSAATLAYLVLMAIIAGRDLALLILLFVAVGAVGYLWAGPQAQAFFTPGQLAQPAPPAQPAPSWQGPASPGTPQR